MNWEEVNWELKLVERWREGVISKGRDRVVRRCEVIDEKKKEVR